MSYLISKEIEMIYHITKPTIWNSGLSNGAYVPVEFEQDGFIHCSNEEQVLDVAGRYYTGQPGLLLLRIDPDRLTSKLVYENLVGGDELYPHIYGPLNLEAVNATAEFNMNSADEFVLPVDWKPVSRV